MAKNQNIRSIFINKKTGQRSIVLPSDFFKGKNKDAKKLKLGKLEFMK